MSREDAEGPVWISIETLMALHAQQIERYGGAHGVLDANVVSSALARPRNLAAYEPESDIADQTAAYLVGFARTQGFHDGNKRTALATALVFLAVNGYELDVPSEELLVLTMKVALGEYDDAVLSAYLRDRIRPPA